jgi:hypothetical protein
VARAVALAGIVATLWSLPALGEEAPRVRIEIVRKGDTTTCPDEEALRREVAARLGRDPFAEGAAARVALVLSEEQGRFAAEIWYRDASGHESGPSELDSTSCAELVMTAAERLAILIGPVSAPVAPSSAPAAAARRPIRIRAAVGALGSLGAAPSTAFGLSGEIGVRFETLSLALEVRGDLPAEGLARSDEYPNAMIRSSLVLGTLVPCFRLGSVLLCGLVSVGALSKTAEGFAPAAPTAFVGVGGRLGWEVGFLDHDAGLRPPNPQETSFLDRFAVQPHVDVLATALGAKLCDGDCSRDDSAVVWSSPPVSASLGLSLVGYFW